MKGDYDPNSLIAELELVSIICWEFQPINFGDVVKVIQSIRNVAVIITIVLTNGVTFATPERLSFMLRQLKTCLCSAMTQKRLITPSLIHENQAIVDEILWKTNEHGKRIC